jgi:hypothetical protein
MTPAAAVKWQRRPVQDDTALQDACQTKGRLSANQRRSGAATFAVHILRPQSKDIDANELRGMGCLQIISK